MAGSALLCTRPGGAGSSIMQATLVYLSSPPEMRGRMLGVLSVNEIGSGPGCLIRRRMSGIWAARLKRTDSNPPTADLQCKS
jgi:hypothetical protein